MKRMIALGLVVLLGSAGTALAGKSSFERYARRMRTDLCSDTLDILKSASTSLSGAPIISDTLGDSTALHLSVNSSTGSMSLTLGTTLVSSESATCGDDGLHLHNTYETVYGTFDFHFEPGDTSSEVIATITLPDWPVTAQRWTVYDDGTVSEAKNCKCKGASGTLVYTCKTEADCNDSKFCKQDKSGDPPTDSAWCEFGLASEE